MEATSVSGNCGALFIAYPEGCLRCLALVLYGSKEVIATRRDVQVLYGSWPAAYSAPRLSPVAA